MSNRNRLTVQLDGRGYVVDAAKLQRQFSFEAKDRINPAASHDVSRTPRVLKKTWTDWSLGAGQKIADGDNYNARRYQASLGFDPFKYQGRLVQVPETILEQDLATTGRVTFHATTDGGAASERLYMLDAWGNQPYVKTNPTDDFVTFGGAFGNGRNYYAQKMASIGNTIYFAMGADVRMSVNNAAMDFFSNEDADMISTVAGRIIAGNLNEIFELSAAGAKTTIFTHHLTGFRWYGAVPAAGGMYAWGAAYEGPKRRGAVYYFETIDYDGSYAPARIALPLSHDEYVITMKSHGGYLFLGTNYGVRMAEAIENNDLRYGPLIKLESYSGFNQDPIAPGVDCLWVQGDEIHFGWSKYDFIGSNTIGTNFEPLYFGTGKIKLADLVRDLQPPYCTYAMFPMQSGVAGYAITDVIVYKDRLLFARMERGESDTLSIAGDTHIYIQELLTHDTIMNPAGIVLGQIDMNTTDLKTFTQVNVIESTEGGANAFQDNAFGKLINPSAHFDPVQAIPITNASTGLVNLYQIDLAQEDSGGRNYRISGQETANFLFFIDHPTFTVISQIESIEMDAVVRQPPNEVLVLPIVLDNVVDDGRGRRVGYNTGEELNTLWGLMERGDLTELTIAGHTYLGYIFNIGFEESEFRSIDCDAITGPVSVFFQRIR